MKAINHGDHLFCVQTMNVEAAMEGGLISYEDVGSHMWAARICLGFCHACGTTVRAVQSPEDLDDRFVNKDIHSFDDDQDEVDLILEKQVIAIIGQQETSCKRVRDTKMIEKIMGA